MCAWGVDKSSGLVESHCYEYLNRNGSTWFLYLVMLFYFNQIYGCLSLLLWYRATLPHCDAVTPSGALFTVERVAPFCCCCCCNIFWIRLTVKGTSSIEQALPGCRTWKSAVSAIAWHTGSVVQCMRGIVLEKALVSLCSLTLNCPSDQTLLKQLDISATSSLLCQLRSLWAAVSCMSLWAKRCSVLSSIMVFSISCPTPRLA